MTLSCLFGHKWDGCKCVRCGKIRNEQHDWDLCKGRCKRCDAKHEEQHDWNGCKCSHCGKTRDEQHDWDGCKCKRCGINGNHVWNGNKCSRCGEVKKLTQDDIKRFNVIIDPFKLPSSGFYDESMEQKKKNALKKILSEGVLGEKFLLDYLLCDVTINGGYFSLKNYGEQAHMEWVKKSDIVRALSNTDDKKIIDKLSEILMLKGKEQQYWVIFQPAVAETLGRLKKYDVLEKYINSGQNVPAVLLSKDILRLHKLGVIDKEENIRDENGFTPLHKAVNAKDVELIKKLLESGADIDVVCSIGEYNIGQTALYMAVNNKNIEIAKLLIEHKANLPEAELNGAFPLQKAAAMGLYDIAKLLVENGADKLQKTTTGKTALMWAEQNGHSNIAELLR